MPAARAFLTMQEFILFFWAGVSFMNSLIFRVFAQRGRNFELAFIQPETGRALRAMTVFFKR